MLCCPHCSMLSTILFSIVTPDCGLIQAQQCWTILLTILNKVGRKTLFNAVFVDPKFPEQVVHFCYLQPTYLVWGLYSIKAAFKRLYWLCAEITDEHAETGNWYDLLVTEVNVKDFYMFAVHHFEDARSVEIAILSKLSTKKLPRGNWWYCFGYGSSWLRKESMSKLYSWLHLSRCYVQRSHNLRKFPQIFAVSMGVVLGITRILCIPFKILLLS